MSETMLSLDDLPTHALTAPKQELSKQLIVLACSLAVVVGLILGLSGWLYVETTAVKELTGKLARVSKQLKEQETLLLSLGEHQGHLDTRLQLFEAPNPWDAPITTATPATAENPVPAKYTNPASSSARATEASNAQPAGDGKLVSIGGQRMSLSEMLAQIQAMNEAFTREKAN